MWKWVDEMDNKTSNPVLNQVLEVGPVVVFFLVFLWRKGETFSLWGQEYSPLIQATAVFVPIMILATAIGYIVNRSVSRIQVLTLVLVIIFGALTVFLNNESFFKMKPTLIYLLFGGALAFGFWRGQNYLHALMGDRLPMQEQGWSIIARRLMFFFFGLAALNEFVWRGFSSETWVYFKTFGLTAAILVFMLSQARVFMKYAEVEPDQNPSNEADEV